MMYNTRLHSKRNACKTTLPPELQGTTSISSCREYNSTPQIPEEKDLTSVCFIEHNNVPILYAHGMRQLITSMRVSLGKLNDNQIPRLADISNSVDGIVPVPMFPNTTLQMISYSVFKRKGLIMGMQQNPEATEFVAMHRIDDTLPAVSRSCRRSRWGVEVAESNRKKCYVVSSIGCYVKKELELHT